MKFVNINSILKLLIIVDVALCYSCISFGGWYSASDRSTTEVTNYKNTYIRFKLDSNSNLLKSDTFNFIVKWQNKENFLKPFLIINPEYGYWSKYYANYEKLPSKIYGFNSDMRFNFLTNCEYKMPASSGMNQYKLMIKNEKLNITGFKEEQIDLPPDYSIRLNFKIKEVEIEFSPPFEQTFKKEKDRTSIKEIRKVYEIIATVEPNPEPDEDKPCEISKD
ncbi:hypothetical protein [Leptospira interrogans]|uniref:hypothetical protein n=1 Tax=Leptospira interrogans TaxID=173 RepID=UPI0002BC54D1|nr:hypothetical protein [Leptospira interrogans]AJR16553.1 hypothetical protein LIL_30014 [Leptospira interrogans serovar Linhai str. 56609]